MSQPLAAPPVVVGVRQEQTGLLDYARSWAQRWRAHLRVVHAYSFVDVAADIYSTTDSAGPQTRALKLLDRAREHLQASGPIELELSLDDGPASTMLERESEHASAVVVGADDVSWLRHLAGAEVARYVAMHAHAPVFVVPSGTCVEELREVVLEIDEEGVSEGPVRFAFDTAVRTGASVRILCVVPRTVDLAEPGRHGSRLTKISDEWRSKYPTVKVTPALLCGDVVDEAVIAASTAQLVVLGRPNEPRHGKLFGLYVAETLIREARCPVVIVPENFQPVADWANPPRDLRP